jgi:hypothetical protein
MVKKMPAAGRPKRTPAAKVPPRIPGATGGKMRARTDADNPANPIGAAAKPKQQKTARSRKS